jgi:hypothetical protein
MTPLEAETATETRFASEPLLPRYSLRAYFGLITVCAGILAVFRVAFVYQSRWAICLSMGCATLIACFVMYAIFFVIADGIARSLHHAQSLVQPKTNPPSEMDRS